MSYGDRNQSHGLLRRPASFSAQTRAASYGAPAQTSSYATTRTASYSAPRTTTNSYGTQTSMGEESIAPPPQAPRNWWTVLGWGLVVATATGLFWGVTSGPMARPVTRNKRRSSRRRVSRNAKRKTTKRKKTPKRKVRKWRVPSSEERVGDNIFGVGPDGPYFLGPAGVGYVGTPAALATYRRIFGRNWR